jgi:hypothetical protein
VLALVGGGGLFVSTEGRQIMTTKKRVVELTPARVNEIHALWLGPERRMSTVQKILDMTRALMAMDTEEEVTEWARWQDPCGVPFGELEPYLLRQWREVRKHKKAA